MLTTSVTPSTRSRMIRSMPAFSVCGRRRTADARAGQLDRDDAGGLVDVVQHDVAAVGLEGRADHLDRLLDLFTHGSMSHSIQRSVRTMHRSWSTHVARSAGIPAAVLAHQGGWDEMLLVAGPIVVVAGLLWLARRRVTERRRHGDRDQSDATRAARASEVGERPLIRRTPASTARELTTPAVRRVRMSAPTLREAADEVVVAAVDVVRRR